MLTAIGQIAAVLAGLVTLVLLLYREYWSPKAKARRQAAKDGIQAAENLDPSGVTAAFDKLRGRKKPK